MNAASKKLVNELLALPLDQQVAIAQVVWDHIEHFADPQVEQAWMEESERRWREIEEGKVECVDADVAMRRARDILKR